MIASRRSFVACVTAALTTALVAPQVATLIFTDPVEIGPVGEFWWRFVPAAEPYADDCVGYMIISVDVAYPARCGVITSLGADPA